MSDKSLKIGIKQFVEFIVLFVVIWILWTFEADIWQILSVGVIMIMSFMCMRDVYANGFFFFFLISFFIYLMSGDIAELLFDKHYHLQFGKDATLHAHKCICISLLSIWAGYVFTSSKSQKNINQLEAAEKNKATPAIIPKIKQASKLIYGATFVILLFNTIDTVRFVAVHGYVAYYTSFDPILPSVIIEIGEFAPVALCVFLATFPTKKEASVVIKSYLLYAVLSLFIGARGALVYNVIFILCYCFYRNYTDRGHTVWVSKKLIAIMILSLPFLFSFLFLYEYIRTGREVEFSSFGETIVDFFVNIGASSQIIKDGYEYADKIPKWRFYSFGGTLNYFKYGTLFNLFNLSSIPSRHSAAFALESHSLGEFISYLTMRTQFLEGHGSGSSFIAELYADFGYKGIVFGSMIYGCIFKKMSNLKSKNWVSSSVKLYIYMELLKAPRSSFDGFVACVVNVNYLLIMVFIYIFAVSYFSEEKFL